MLLAGFGAVFAFEAWWRTGSGATPSSMFCSAGSPSGSTSGRAVSSAAPFLFALGDLIWTKEDRGGSCALIVLGTGSPSRSPRSWCRARASLLALIAAKRATRRCRSPRLGLMSLQAGTPSTTSRRSSGWPPSRARAAAARTGRGPALHAHRRRGAFAGAEILSPLGLAQPVILNRYLLPVLPFVLLWFAYGHGRRGTRKASARVWAAQRYAVRLAMLFLFWTGPFLLSPASAPARFMHHTTSSASSRRAPPCPPRWCPRSNAGFSAAGARGALGAGVGLRPLVLTSTRASTAGASSSPAPYDVQRDRRSRSETMVPPEPAALLASPARTLVVHVRLPWEEDRVVDPGRPPARPDASAGPPLYPPGRRAARRRSPAVGAARLSPTHGRAWDLDRCAGGRGRLAPMAFLFCPSCAARRRPIRFSRN